MRWFAVKRNNTLFALSVLTFLIFVAIGVWALTERSHAQNLQSQLAVAEQKIERNPLIAPPSTLKVSDFTMSGDWLMVRVGKDVKIFTVEGTSMLPLVATGGKVIALPVTDISNITVGSFVIFNPLNVPSFVGHQVVEIGQDTQGWFAQTKGTGNFERDFWKVRITDIKYRVVLIVY